MCNLVFSNFTHFDNCMVEKPFIKNKACGYHMPRLNMACVGTCTCNFMSFLVRPD